jgi:hypothetical protein
MKTYHVTFIALLLGLVTLACYEDKGNYAYTDVEEAIIELDDNYTVYRFDTLRVTPKITTLHGNDDYDYRWILYRLNELIDTIGREKDLVYPMIRVSDQFRVLFTATSKKTAITYAKYMHLRVTSREADGWYVLKDIDGHAGVDLFFNEAGRSAPDFLEALGDYRMEGKARRISFLSEYVDYLDPEDPAAGGMPTARMFFISDREILAYDPLAAAVTRDSRDLFYYAPEPLDARAIFGVSEESYLLAGGNLHEVPLMTSGSGRFGSPRKRYDGLPFKLADYASCLPATFIASAILFDETNHSFMIKYAYVTQLYDHPEPELSNMSHDLKFMGTKITEAYFDGTAYALMQHREDLTWQFFAIDVGWGFNPPMTYPVASSSGLTTATLRAQHGRLDLVYYAQDDRVIAYNILDGSEEVVYTAPAGERVTMLKCEFDAAPELGDFRDPYHLLAIGTNNGDDYSLRLFFTNINTGRLDSEFKHFQGTGEPVDVKPGSPTGSMTANI